MNEKYLEEANLIPKDELLEHVSMLVIRNSGAGIPFLDRWSEAGIKKEPLEIFDLNGQPLFYDYTIRKGTEILGTARATASRILGTSVLAYELGPRYWDFDSAVKKLTTKVKREFPKQKILSTKLICYSYPKLGVMFEMAEGQKEKKRLIYDVADLSLIPDPKALPSMEGAFAWSFYDSLAEKVRAQNLRNHESINKWRLGVTARLRKELVSARVLVALKDKIACAIKLNVTKQLQYCTHYSFGESRSHHCFSLHGQQVNNYCAVATAQMILCYYRYYYAQNDIAPALNYSASSGCPPDQSVGYESLTKNHLDAAFDGSPTWETARDQINALHPLKSGIAGHARACAGYSYVWWLCTQTKDKKLYIYDPWPWNSDYKLGGTVYWEDWDAVKHTNYVLANLLYR